MEFFQIYLPIAGLHFNVLLLLLIGFTVGVCGGFIRMTSLTTWSGAIPWWRSGRIFSRS